MAQSFKNLRSRNVGTGLTLVGSYSVGSGIAATVIGLTIANTSTSEITVNVTLYDGVNDCYLVKSAPIPVGSSLVVVGGDQKVVLESLDGIRVSSSADASCDVVMSLLEIS